MSAPLDRTYLACNDNRETSPSTAWPISIARGLVAAGTVIVCSFASGQEPQQSGSSNEKSATATEPAPVVTTVEGGGRALRDALLSAEPGATLHVQAGCYDAVSVNRGITVVCDDGVELKSKTGAGLVISEIPEGAVVDWVGGRFVPGLSGGVRVEDSSGGVFLRDISLAGELPFRSCSLRVQRCRGPVMLEGICGQNARVIIRHAYSVSFDRCPALPPVHATGSMICMSRTQSTAEGATPLVALDSHVCLSSCEFTAVADAHGDSSPAVRIRGGMIRLDARCRLTARCEGCPAPTAAIQASDDARVQAAADARLSSPTAEVIGTNCERVDVPSVVAARIVGGDHYEIRVAAPPDSMTGTFASIPVTPDPRTRPACCGCTSGSRSPTSAWSRRSESTRSTGVPWRSHPAHRSRSSRSR